MWIQETLTSCWSCDTIVNIFSTQFMMLHLESVYSYYKKFYKVLHFYIIFCHLDMEWKHFCTGIFNYCYYNIFNIVINQIRHCHMNIYMLNHVTGWRDLLLEKLLDGTGVRCWELRTLGNGVRLMYFWVSGKIVCNWCIKETPDISVDIMVHFVWDLLCRSMVMCR